jgi:ankyrin repeat protein
MSVRSGSKDGSQSDVGTGAAGGTGTGTRQKAGNGLFDAVVNRDITAAKVAIKAGADVNKQDENGWTPLRKAARAGDMEMVSLLLDNGGNVTDNDKVVVLTAASWGRVDALRQILRAKADISGNSEWEISPLVSACQHGHLRAVKLLIEHEADVNQIDRQGNDPLMTAWESNRPEIVFYLVEMVVM